MSDLLNRDRQLRGTRRGARGAARMKVVAPSERRHPRLVASSAPAKRPPSRPRSSATRARNTYMGAVVALMLGFLAWLLYQWIDYLSGAQVLASIFAIVLLGAGAAVLSFAHHG